MPPKRKDLIQESGFLPDIKPAGSDINGSRGQGRLVIFDVDGVLVDSFAAHEKSWIMLAHETGVTFTPHDFALTFGQTSRDIVLQFWKVDPRDAEAIRALDDRKEHLYRGLIYAHCPIMDGAAQLIDALSTDGWRLAVGSSGPTENVDLVLDGLARRHLMSPVVTGRDVSRGKPDPEIFQRAAELAGISPDRCLVIEDAPVGIQAARAAGMKCVALLSTGRHRSDFASQPPDLIVQSLGELNSTRLASLFDS